MQITKKTGGPAPVSELSFPFKTDHLESSDSLISN